MGRICRIVPIAMVLLASCGDGGETTPARTSPTTPASATVTTAPTTPTSTATTVAPTSAPETTLPIGPAVRVYGGNPNRHEVALTFDAGSDVGYTTQILDTLRDRGITATFSVTGEWAEANPDALRRIAADGHQLMSHGYDHRSFTGVATGTDPLTFAERRDQLKETEATVAQIAGVTLAPWFRPPYGDTDDALDADLGMLGYRYDVLWTVDSLGWQGLTAAEIAERCVERAEPGAIFLFHVGTASQDAAALPALIDALQRLGYGFVSVEDLLRG